MSLFHIIGRDEWLAVANDDAYTPAGFADEGFVHLSYAHQVGGSAARHFPDRDDLLVLELDADALGAPVVEEDLYGSGVSFPHLYAPVPIAAVRSVHRLTPGPDGTYTITA